jgi:hypothetical protein
MEEWKGFVGRMYQENVMAYAQHTHANQMLEQANHLLQQRVVNLKQMMGIRGITPNSQYPPTESPVSEEGTEFYGEVNLEGWLIGKGNFFPGGGTRTTKFF